MVYISVLLVDMSLFDIFWLCFRCRHAALCFQPVCVVNTLLLRSNLSICSDKSQNIIEICKNINGIFKNINGICKNTTDILTFVGLQGEFRVQSRWV